MKILNLYACLGGNRAKWGAEHEITSVELDPELARLYSERFPNDEVVIGDAHEYLLDNFYRFNFIWTSPPCPTHSRARNWNSKLDTVYPDMKLYQEIILLKEHFAGKYCVENVIPYYEPLIPGKIRGRHIFWTNFPIPSTLSTRKTDLVNGKIKDLERFHGIDLSTYKGEQRKDKIARNLVDYEAGKVILDYAMNRIPKTTSVQTSILDLT